CQQESYWRTF
nr:immunoglobulin light chain junction region [Macaca mulatta]